MDNFVRNAVLNGMNGTIAGAQDYAFPWAVASSIVSAFALSSTQQNQRIIPRSTEEADERGIVPMFLIGMAGWYVGRKLFPPPLTPGPMSVDPVTPE